MIIKAPHELMCSDTIGTEVISTDTVPAPSYSLFLGFAAIAQDLLVLYGSNLQKIGNDVLWLQSCDSTGWDFCVLFANGTRQDIFCIFIFILQTSLAEDMKTV